MRTRRYALFLTVSLAACSSGTIGGTGPAPDGGAIASGGASSTGGATSVGGGGAQSGTGGAPSTTGGSSGTGGAVTGGSGNGGSGNGGTAGSTGGVPSDSGSQPTGPNVDRSDAKLREFELDPHDLDSSVVDSLTVQYAQLDTRAVPLGKLVFFLPGHNNVPRDWRDHGRELASFGFHVAIPSYNNRWNGCSGNDCNRNTRWEALVGEDVSDAIVASRADSAEGRVEKMLEHLVTADPTGDWGYYLDSNGGLRFERMIIAGISHGAASTGVYAERRPFTRAVMHSGSWGSPRSPVTPVSVWYGFAHTEDPSFDAIAGGFDQAGLPGQRTSIDGASPPYGDAHKLITSAPGGDPHVGNCAHSASPVDSNGDYVFEPAWRHLYGAP
jgi:hypothetical protein